MAALGHQAQVGAAKGHDPRVGVGAGGDGQAIGPGAGAEDGVAGLGAAVRMGDAQRAPLDVDPLDLAAGGERRRPRRVCPGRRTRATAGKSTMPVSGECSPATPRAWGSIASMPAASIRRRPGTPFAFPRRSSSSSRPSSEVSVATITFPQRSLGDAPLRAVLIQLARALHAQARLERAGHVVDAGVDHARVVAGLMRADLGLALEHADRRLRVAPDQLARDRQAHDPASHHREVAALWRLGGLCGCARHRAQATGPLRRDRREPWPRPRPPGRPRTAPRRRRLRACARWPSGAPLSARAWGGGRARRWR